MFVETKREGEATSLKPIEPWRCLMLQAADILERRGHTKNLLCSSDGRVCFRGALVAALGINLIPEAMLCKVMRDDMDQFSLELFSIADDHMQKYIGQYPVDWNNAAERTGAEVITAMRECAAQ